MDHKQLLHELLKDDQEPFHLQSYISDRKSLLKKPSPATALQLTKRKPVAAKRSNLSRHACFLSFQGSPDVRKSPFLDFPSPAKSPCKSPTNTVFLHIPSRTAALLVEAAMRIQKQPKTQSKNAGFGLLGSFLKRLKDRSKNKKRAIGNDFKVSGDNATRVEKTVEETTRISCSCSNRRLSSADWTENNEDKSLDFEASTSSCGSECSEIDGDFAFGDARFCTSPFRFSLHRNASSSGHSTPEFCSPADSPNRHMIREKENHESRKSDNVQGEEEEEDKEQCSPVSVLDPPFDDDGRVVDAEEEDDYDLGCSYENVQRAKEQLLYRLRRFEKLAELDPIELERKLLEGSDEEDYMEELEESCDISTDMKRLVSDLIVEEKDETMGRICKRFDLWKEGEFNTIDMMVGVDLKREINGWTKFEEQVEETASEIELAIFGLLIEEVLYTEETDMVPC